MSSNLYLPSSSSWVSVALNSNTPPSAAAPVSPTSLSVEEEGKGVICWRMSIMYPFFAFTFHIEFSECCVWFQCFTQWCCSYVSNVIACLWEEKGKSVLLMYGLMCLSFIITLQIEFSECRVWFQCLTQWCCSRVSNPVVCLCEKKGKEWFALWVNDERFLVFTTHIELEECCVCFQCLTQWRCTFFSNTVFCW